MAILDTSYKSILKLALPIIFGSFVQALILFVDSYFLSIHSKAAFIAAGMVSLPYITLFMIGNGLGDSGQIFMARQFGKGEISTLRRAFQSNLINLFLVSIFLTIVSLVISRFFLPGMIEDISVRQASVAYLDIRSYGYLFSLTTLGITSFFIATGRSRIVLINTLILCVVNIFLDYGLIFGHYGLPEMGVEGAALATIIAEAAVAVFSVLYLFFDQHEVSRKLLSGLTYSWSVSKRVITLAYPLMAQGFLAVSAWTVFFYMIETMGVHQMEVSRILHTLYWVALVPMFGFTVATRTYVSNLLAEGDMVKIKKTVKKLLIINYAFILLFIHGFLFYPEWWINLVNPKADINVIADTKYTLAYLFLSIIIHGAAGIYQNVVAGCGDTKTAFKMESVSILIYLTFASYVIFEEEWGIRQVWISEFAYFTPFLILTYTYYKLNKWQKQRI